MPLHLSLLVWCVGKEIDGIDADMISDVCYTGWPVCLLVVVLLDRDVCTVGDYGKLSWRTTWKLPNAPQDKTMYLIVCLSDQASGTVHGRTVCLPWQAVSKAIDTA